MNLNKKIVMFIGFILTTTNFTSLAAEESKEFFEASKSCFRKPFSSYDQWLAVIADVSTKRFKEESKVQESLSRFKKRFKQEVFEKYKSNLSCITFNYRSDEGVVEGILIKPKNIEGELPVIIYNRGGNGKYGRIIMAGMYSSLFPLAERGFIVLGTQYRGAVGKTDPSFDDEFGGKDVNDVVNIAKLIPHIEGAAVNRVGMLGASRGAMQSYLSIKAGVEVKALATIAGNTDLKAGLTFRPSMENVYKRRIPEYQTQAARQLSDRSALHWIEQLDAELPILLIHGDEDKKVAPFHSLNMAKKLSDLNRLHKLVLYSGDDHNLRLNRSNALTEVGDWFEKYL